MCSRQETVFYLTKNLLSSMYIVHHIRTFNVELNVELNMWILGLTKEAHVARQPELCTYNCTEFRYDTFYFGSNWHVEKYHLQFRSHVSAADYNSLNHSQLATQAFIVHLPQIDGRQHFRHQYPPSKVRHHHDCSNFFCFCR